MEGLSRSLELTTMLAAYEQQVDGYESLVRHYETKARGGLRGRYWRRQAEKCRQRLDKARENLDQTRAEYEALEAYNSPDAQAARIQRGQIF